MIAIIILFLFMFPAYKCDYNIIVYDQIKPKLLNHANDTFQTFYDLEKKNPLITAHTHNSWSVEKYLSNDTIQLVCSVFAFKTSLDSLKTSGGVMWSNSAPMTAMGTSTSESDSRHSSLNLS